MILGFLYDPIFLPTISAYVCSLLGKVISYSFQNRQLNFHQVLRDGGMPSSHTAFVLGLSTAVFLTEGFSSLFWVTLAFASIVIHDAMGLRSVTGSQSKAINQIVKAMSVGKKLKIGIFREIMGHTRLQVFAGAVVGILSSWGIHSLIF